MRERGGSEAYAPLRVKLPGSGREVSSSLAVLQGGGAESELYHQDVTLSLKILSNYNTVEDRISYYVSLLLLYVSAYYGASEAVNLFVVGTWRNPPNIRNKNEPVILENKISCSLTVVCASSFRPSQYNKK